MFQPEAASCHLQPSIYNVQPLSFLSMWQNGISMHDWPTNWRNSCLTKTCKWIWGSGDYGIGLSLPDLLLGGFPCAYLGMCSASWYDNCFSVLLWYSTACGFLKFSSFSSSEIKSIFNYIDPLYNWFTQWQPPVHYLTWNPLHWALKHHAIWWPR